MQRSGERKANGAHVRMRSVDGGNDNSHDAPHIKSEKARAASLLVERLEETQVVVNPSTRASYTTPICIEDCMVLVIFIFIVISIGFLIVSNCN